VAVLTAGVLACAGVALAQGMAPLPGWVRSAIPKRDQLAVHAAPDPRSRRRGALLRSARVPVLARLPGAGDCPAFVQIGAEAYACERDVDASSEPPAAAPAIASGSDLPYEYLQVVREGTRGYAAPADFFTDDYTTAFGAGFSLAVATRVRHQNVPFVRTRAGHYVRERDLRSVRPSDFAGVQLAAGALSRLGWVMQPGAPLFDEHTGELVRRAGRLERVAIDRERGDRLVLEGGLVIDAAAVRRPVLQAPPPEIARAERWLDVDLDRQLLVAYEGALPRFATLISSGKERAGTRTPRGAFRIWVKLQSSDMRDHEAYELERSYALEQVPWVQYFQQGYGLHAAFWHDRFGEPYSRGCINLSPRDARTLFEFTQPALPPGWFAVRPAPSEPGTLVVVR
jgi:hypothetical protein